MLISDLGVLELFLQNSILLSSKNVGVKLIESSLSLFASVVRSVWIVGCVSAWRLSEGLILGSHLFLILSKRLFTKALVSFFVKPVIGGLSLSLIHHLDDLDGEIIKLWLEIEFLDLLVTSVSLSLLNLALFILEESLLVLQEGAKISGRVNITLLQNGWLEGAFF